MANMQAVTTAPFYEILINDGGFDGGSNSHVTVSDLPQSMDPAELQAAIEAFAAALTAGTYSLVRISYNTTVTTVL